MTARHSLYSSLPTRAGVASVEWEELPSLPSVLLRRHVPPASYAIATELVQQAQARLADTHINGLASREIVEPDIFKHFFGSSAAR